MGEKSSGPASFDTDFGITLLTGTWTILKLDSLI